jgi:hypothetical protein
MFKESHFDDQVVKNSLKKPIKKNPADTQTDLLADFDRADKERAFREKEPESAKEKTLPVLSPEEFAKLEVEMDERTKEAYRQYWQKDTDKKNYKSKEFIKRYAKSDKKNSLKIWEDLDKEEKEALEAKELARQQKIKKYLDKVQGRQSPNSFEEIASPADDVDEDGSIKPLNPGEEYYGRFR